MWPYLTAKHPSSASPGLSPSDTCPPGQMKLNWKGSLQFANRCQSSKTKQNKATGKNMKKKLSLGIFFKWMTSSAEGVSVGTLAFTSGRCLRKCLQCNSGCRRWGCELGSKIRRNIDYGDTMFFLFFFLRQSLHEFYNRFNSKVASIFCSAVYPTLKILLTHHVPISSIKILFYLAVYISHKKKMS